MAGVAKPDRLTVLHDVRNDQHLGIARQLELAQHVDLQGAEAAAELNLPGWRDALVAKHQHVVFEVGAVQRGQVAVAERAGQVEADDVGAQRRVEWLDTDSLQRWDRFLAGYGDLR